MRLGTSSPKISVKKDITSVIRTTAIVFIRETGIFHPQLMKHPTRCSERLSAAKADPRKPASVIPIWIVDRKPDGFSAMWRSFSAFLSPSSIIFLSLVVLSDITAISVAAKNELNNISIT